MAAIDVAMAEAAVNVADVNPTSFIDLKSGRSGGRFLFFTANARSERESVMKTKR
jgi:hypothetical protein